jgi:tetratricopeptide (TPR) repeat protein
MNNYDSYGRRRFRLVLFYLHFLHVGMKGRKVRKLFLLSSLIVLLAGCTTTLSESPFEKQARLDESERSQRKMILDTWIGQTEWSLVASFGRPFTVFEAGMVTEEYPEGEPRTLLYYRPHNMWMPGATTTHVTEESGMIGDAPYIGESTTTDYSNTGHTENVGDNLEFIIDSNHRIKYSIDSWNYPIKPYDEKLDEGAISYDRRCYIDKQKGDLDKAFTDCTKAIELIPNDAQAYNDLCDVYSAKGKGNSAEAIACYGKSLQLNSVNMSDNESLRRYYHLEKYGSSQPN